MAHRPRATLGRVQEDLGSTLLEVLAGNVRHDAEVGGVVIHDRLDPPIVTEGTLVLGVGLGDPAEISEVLRSAGKSGAVGLIIRVSAALDDDVRRAAADSGVALFGLTRGASWVQVSALLRSLLAFDDLGVDDDETLGGAAAGDLFSLAGAVSALLDAPITIEDLNSRVLAFSPDQDQADEPRKETVLGRQVPERYTRELESIGTFRQLYSSDRPVYITLTDTPDYLQPRVAIRVRAGDEILGSMWAAVTEPLSAEREQAFVDSAKLVALHMLRHRAGADVGQRLRAELVASLLEGGPNASEAATRLGLTTGRSCVLALSLRGTDDASSREAQLQRVNGAFALHLNAVHPRTAVALVGDTIYGVFPLLDQATDQRAATVAGEFLERVSASHNIVVGVGRHVDDPAELPVSRADADRAVRVLRSGGPIAVPARATTRVARAEDVQTASLLLELGDLMTAERHQPAGPVSRLAAYDAEHDTTMLATLRAWLDAFGDVGKAAAAIHVHPNTFRYRLRRISQISGLDLDDPDARFAAMLQLRLTASHSH